MGPGRSAVAGVPAAADFTAHLARYPGDVPLPRDLVEQARTLHAGLCASAPSRVVLHGDLHLYNPLSGPEPTVELLRPRLEQLADGLGTSHDRLVAWGFVQAVLSEVWDNDSGRPVPPGRALQVALRLRPLLPS